MSKELTVAELVAIANAQANDALTEEAIRKLIRANKVRSLNKLSAVIAEALARLPEGKAKRKLKTKTTSATLKVKKARATAVTIHEKGPRGFKFGPVWLKSIAEGKGVALKPANFPKLKDHARAADVEVTADLTQVEVAAAIAKPWQLHKRGVFTPFYVNKFVNF